MVWLPVERPLHPVEGYGPYAPPSILNSRPAVEELTVIVPPGAAHVGSTAASVAVGADGAVPISWVSVVSQPEALRTLMVCVPVERPLHPDAGYTPYAPPSILNSRPAVEELTVMVPPGAAHVGSTAASVAVGANGAVPISWVSVVSQPEALRTLMVWLPVERPLHPVEGYGPYAPPSILNSMPAVEELAVIIPPGAAHVG